MRRRGYNDGSNMQLGLYQLAFWLWMATFVIWAIGSVLTKQTIGSFSDRQSRIVVWIVALSWWLLFDRNLGGVLGWRFLPETALGEHSGLVLTTAGLALAVWARFYLGGNWGTLVELKKDHQLIRTGPYTIVRHPIYSGFMLATLGTAIIERELHGLLAFVLITIVWTYKSRLEEAFLIGQFGAEYDQYRKQVKGLIPFVW
jgi:protein-S-isoprenylcysteine O-methyltransferase